MQRKDKGWRKALRCHANGTCIEVRGRFVRDSKNKHMRPLEVSQALIKKIKYEF